MKVLEMSRCGAWIRDDDPKLSPVLIEKENTRIALAASLKDMSSSR